MPFFKPKKKLTLKFNRHPKKPEDVLVALHKKMRPERISPLTNQKVRAVSMKPRVSSQSPQAHRPPPPKNKSLSKPKVSSDFDELHSNSSKVKPKAKTRIIPDVVTEQTEELYQTTFCPESIKDAKEIRKHPEEHIEINIIRKSRVVDVFCIPVDKKTFHYKKLKYHVKEDAIYLMPTKSNLLMPSSYYREGNSQPAMFKNTNQGITGKALSLLYKDELYRQILFAEDPKYNLFIVILLIALLIAFGIGAYFVFVHGGGIITPSVPLPEVTP